jgi:2-succinyl-6-hydroxy-2,4-cyclohexadiene-1-carboxylate synthase
MHPNGLGKNWRLYKMFYALHGFLGLPDDWNQVMPDANAVDILASSSPSDKIGLDEWAEKFNAAIAKKSENNILIGYSLGGRLAMHALIKNPSLWKGAILVSTHPGLKTNQERQKRLIQDEIWAKRFEVEPWDTLMTAWNAQQIFSSNTMNRLEHNYSRGFLANILRFWSLGHQHDLSQQLKELPIPILWIAGEKDMQYSEQAHGLSFSNPDSEVWIAPNSGHRVPWICPNVFREKVNKFIHTILVQQEL